MGDLNKDKYTFLITSRSILLGKRNILDKHCSKNKKMHFIFKNIFLNCAIWDNVETNVELARPQMTIWRMITNPTNNFSE